MAKKKSYDAHLRQQMGDLIDQLQLSRLEKQSLKERWLDQMIWADKKASQTRQSYYRLRLTTVVGGVLLPALVGISLQLGSSNKFFRLWFPPLTFALSQVIAVSVAIEEFCKFGDRWRDYRKMAEDLKSEGWQYLQSSGPYEYGMDHLPDSFQSSGQRSTSVNDFSLSGLSSASSQFELNSKPKHQKTHLQNYAQFANRIESIIKNDVQGYVANLMQQQAKQDIQAQKVLAQAQAVVTNKPIIAQLATLDPGYRDPNIVPSAPAPLMAPTRPNSGVIAGAVGTLRVHQDTVFKLSTQPAKALPDAQKVAIPNGSAFGVTTYTIADHNHFQVTLNQGLGANQHTTWFVFAPHVEVIGADNKPATPTPAPAVATVSAPVAPTPVSATAPAITPNGAIQLDVPYLSQLDNTENPFGSCNVTSIAMCLKYLGTKQNTQKQFEDELQDWLETKGLDRHVGEHLAQAVQGYGCQDYYTTTATLEQVKQWLAQGNPIVIHGNFTASGHVVCGIGYNDKGLIIHDPYGEWFEGGYHRNDESNPHKGQALTYSYEMIQRTCIPDGSFWVHFISRAGHSASPTRTIQPMQLSQSVNTSRLTTFSATPGQSAMLITVEQLTQIAPNASKSRLLELTPGINQTLEKYQINTPLRIAHFIAQVAHESDCFNAMEEYASGEAYEGRVEDLGNTEPGDGKRFKGRGLIQLTGRSNYKQFSKDMGKNFVAEPTLVGQPPYAVLVAGWYWNTRSLNSHADKDDVREVTYRINGGYNHLLERETYLKAAKSVLNC